MAGDKGGYKCHLTRQPIKICSLQCVNMINSNEASLLLALKFFHQLLLDPKESLLGSILFCNVESLLSAFQLKRTLVPEAAVLSLVILTASAEVDYLAALAQELWKKQGESSVMLHESQGVSCTCCLPVQRQLKSGLLNLELVLRLWNQQVGQSLFLLVSLPYERGSFMGP